MFSVSVPMLEIVSAKQVTDVSLVVKDSDTEFSDTDTEYVNLSSLVRISVSEGQKSSILGI